MTTLQERGAYPATGFYWHLHHQVLLSWCFNYRERVDFIRKVKPTAEVETRLRLFAPVRGILPTELTTAWAAWNEARAQWNKARVELNEAKVEVTEVGLHKARVELHEARVEKTMAKLDKARVELDKAWVNHADEIRVRHSAECPDCPWDGRTIFPDSESG